MMRCAVPSAHKAAVPRHVPHKAGAQLGHIAIGFEAAVVPCFHQALFFHPAGGLAQVNVAFVHVAVGLQGLGFGLTGLFPDEGGQTGAVGRHGDAP